MSLITFDDFIDVWLKLNQRGRHFIFSKLDFNKKNRTKSAFSDSSAQASNWWNIPYVKSRWNSKITGDSKILYEDFMMQHYFANESNLRMLSIGSGICSHELYLAKNYPQFGEIICLDIAANLLSKASKKADKEGIANIKFKEDDVYKLDLADYGKFDIIFFHASLHHFEKIEQFIKTIVNPLLNGNGHVVINEYVGPNRLQYTEAQIDAINRGLKLLPSKLKRRFKSNLIKNKYHGSGLIRMILADPSECVDSISILPVLRKTYNPILERPYGGNILMSALKDISHNFYDDNSNEYLEDLFLLEDEYLNKNESDFYFGIYQNQKVEESI